MSDMAAAPKPWVDSKKYLWLLGPIVPLLVVWAIYDFHGRWDDVEAEGRGVSANVQLLRTPGHTPEDISTVARVADGTVVFTHAWWTADKPVDDPYCHDLATLRASRARILELATIIVPGHGAPFRPSATTPR